MLQFTHDIMLFLRRFEDVATRILHCLTIFIIIFGLSINLSKSFVIGIGSDVGFAAHVANKLHVGLGVCL